MLICLSISISISISSFNAIPFILCKASNIISLALNFSMETLYILLSNLDNVRSSATILFSFILSCLMTDAAPTLSLNIPLSIPSAYPCIDISGFLNS